MVTFEVPHARSITLSHLLINSFRFLKRFAPLQASHLFKIDTVQYLGGLRRSASSTSLSCNFLSSSSFALSFEFSTMLKMCPQCTLTTISTRSPAQPQSGEYISVWIPYKVPVLSLKTAKSKEQPLTLSTHEAYD